MEGLLISSGIVFIIMYLVFNKHAYPVETGSFRSMNKEEAEKRASKLLTELTGLDTTSATVLSTFWFDEGFTESAYQLGTLEKFKADMETWGLRGSWKVRFLFQEGTALLGMAPGGEVINLELTGHLLDTVGEHGDSQFDFQNIIYRLNGNSNTGIWCNLKSVGEGHLLDEQGAQELTKHYVQEVNSGLRMYLSVSVKNSSITHVDLDPTLEDNAEEEVKRSEIVEALSGMGGMMGALLALIVGVAILALTDGVVDVSNAIILSVVILIAIISTLPSELKYICVNAFDGELPWSTFKYISLITSIVRSLIVAGVVAIATVTGSFVAIQIPLSVFDAGIYQAVWGVWLGLGWLGIAAFVYSVLRRYHKLDILPRASDSSLHIAGHTWSHGISVTIQSSVGEETVFRLLGIPVLLWASGSIWLAVSVTAVLWALMHTGSAMRPRWFRLIELSVGGCILGIAFINVGFICVLTAHFLYNFVTMCAPLLTTRSKTQSQNLVTNS
jgi:hypothetical protein